MIRRHSSSRWALWLFAAALLLKSAMPFLASASAHAQGKALVEVCSVYGVKLASLGEDSHTSTPQSDSVHGGEHCALSALPVFAVVSAPWLVPLSGAVQHVLLPHARQRWQVADAHADWLARLKHGPPAVA